MATTCPGMVPVFPPKYSVWSGYSVSGAFNVASVPRSAAMRLGCPNGADGQSCPAIVRPGSSGPTPSTVCGRTMRGAGRRPFREPGGGRRPAPGFTWRSRCYGGDGWTRPSGTRTSPAAITQPGRLHRPVWQSGALVLSPGSPKRILAWGVQPN
jgi:hypothetical protein